MTLDTPVKELYGVGEKIQKHLNNGGIFTVKDILNNFPRAYQNRGDVRSTNDILSYNEYHSYILTVASEPKAAMVRRGMNILKLRAFDEYGTVQIT